MQKKIETQEVKISNKQKKLKGTPERALSYNATKIINF